MFSLHSIVLDEKLIFFHALWSIKRCWNYLPAETKTAAITRAIQFLVCQTAVYRLFTALHFAAPNLIGSLGHSRGVVDRSLDRQPTPVFMQKHNGDPLEFITQHRVLLSKNCTLYMIGGAKIDLFLK